MIVDKPWFFRSVTAITLLALIIMLVMQVITLPAIAAMSGGEGVIDMRALGYSGDDIRRLLAALTPEGRDYYLSRQLLLDSVLPMAIAVALAGWTIILTRRLRIAGDPFMMTIAMAVSFLALIYAMLDYSENGMIRFVLTLDPETVNDGFVERMSLTTKLKFATGLASGFAVLGLAARLMLQKNRR